jgi:hypothetical protein
MSHFTAQPRLRDYGKTIASFPAFNAGKLSPKAAQRPGIIISKNLKKRPNCK